MTPFRVYGTWINICLICRAARRDPLVAKT
jgi:hypothetical protein